MSKGICYYGECKKEEFHPATTKYLNDTYELEAPKYIYDRKTKTITFTTNHLSLYVVGQNTALTGWSNPFTDIDEADWFYIDLAYVAEKGLIRETAEDTFSPNVTTHQNPFSDIASDK